MDFEILLQRSDDAAAPSLERRTVMANWRAHRCVMLNEDIADGPLQNRRGSLRQLCSVLPCATVEEAFV